MIARFYYASNPKSQTAFANALGISKQFVSKCLKKYPKLTGCQLTDTYQSENQNNNNN